MIRSLTGVVLGVSEMSVLLDVNGLGFDLLCTRAAAALCSAGQRVRLTTYLQISEAGAALYGFASERERELFLKVVAIKGVGGKTGMALSPGVMPTPLAASLTPVSIPERPTYSKLAAVRCALRWVVAVINS